MTFVLRMAVREIRSSWHRLLFFFICIAIGVGAIVSIRSVIQGVRNTLSSEARSLLAADLLLTSNRPFSDTVASLLTAEAQAGRVSARADAIELSTMVRAADPETPGSKMVELRAVPPAFPFYGDVTLREGAYRHDLVRNGGALVRPELLAQLNLRVGDRIQIGTGTFEIRGVIASEPGRRLGAFSLGPRVMIDRADLDATGLLGFGSRVTRQILLKVPPSELEPLTARLRGALANEFVGVRSYRTSEDQIGENLTRAENYLSLVGLVVLILGGIGVSSVTRVFVQQKVRSIAILKCVGASSGQVLAVYMGQVLILGLAGSGLGIGIAGVVLAVVPRFVGDLATMFPVSVGLTGPAVVQGLLIGVLVSVLFSVVPLLDVRQVKPSRLLRQDIPPPDRIDWLKWSVTGTVAAALVGVASWQAGSLRVGLWLSAGFVGTAAVLSLAGWLLVRAIQPLRHARSFALRQAVLHMARPGNQTRVILLAVGLGAFFILGVRGLQANLLRDFAVQGGADSPDLFLIDIQPDQVDPLRAFLRDRTQADPRILPVLRARVVGVEGRDLALDSYEQVRGRGGLAREFTVTYRPELQANETILDGRWWGSEAAGATAGETEVSIEEAFLDRGIHIGDRMRFDVLGRVITARVTSVRKVNWQDFRTGGFMFVFRPGTFEQAPHTFISTLRGPADPDARARMQGDLVRQFPNVSVIDVREVMQTVTAVLDNVTLAVSVVGGLVLFSGMLILIGAVSMTKFRRVYEAAILKTLGASSRLIATMLLLEYGVLGTIAGTVGALGAVGLTWGVARYALDLEWAPTPGITLAGIAATAVLVAAVGVLASLDVLRNKPLSTLRAE